MQFHLRIPLSIPLASGIALCLASIASNGAAQSAQYQSLERIGTTRAYDYAAQPRDNHALTPALTDEHVVRVPGARWISLDFDKVVLGAGSLLEIVALATGERQLLTRDSLKATPASAYFKGDAVRVRLWAGPSTKRNAYAITSLAVGDAIQSPATICGTTDTRVFAIDKRVARLRLVFPSGIYRGTAFLFSAKNCFATAGHNIRSWNEAARAWESATRITAEFNVKRSDATAAVVDQYEHEALAAADHENSGDRGKDWAVFRTKVNTTSGKHAGVVQGAFFRFASTLTSVGKTLRITGFGRHTNAAMHARLLTDTGPLAALLPGKITHRVDTMGGNSGSAIVDAVTGLVVGVHTGAGCTTASTTANVGTRADYGPFFSARRRICAEGMRGDFTPTAFTASTTVWKPASPLKLDSTIKNVGSYFASNTLSAYFMSKDSVFSSTDKILATFPTFGLMVDESRTDSRTIVLSTVVSPGECYIGVVADNRDTIRELDETNNTKTIKGTCVGEQDLTVTAISNVDPLLKAGASISVRSTTSNTGTADIENSVTGIVLSADSTVSSADEFLGSYSTGYLPGKSSTDSIRIFVTVPHCVRSGSCWLGAVADIGGTIVESVESNNTASLKKACERAKLGRYLQWNRVYGDGTTSLTAATMSAKVGGTRRMCISDARSPGYWYLMMWSGSSGNKSYDELSQFSLGLLNSSVFPAWFGKIDATGYAAPSFRLPRVTIATGFTAWTHHYYFTPSFAYDYSGTNVIRMRINP